MAEPKVRFKRDDGSSYPDWTVGKLGDITEKVDRKAPKRSTAPVMMVSQGNGFIYQADKYSRENAGQSLKNYTLLKEGEFAYNHGASKAKPYGVAYCLTEEPEARVPFVYHTFRIADGVNSYWHEALNTSKMDRQLKRMVSSGARMDGLLNINYDTYMDVDVNIPCQEEQQKIADFLYSVDDVIATSEEEVLNLEKQKKAVMKTIFSQQVRFKRADGSDFPEWEEKLLSDVSECLDNQRVPINSTERAKIVGEIPYYGAGSIQGYINKFLFDEDLVLLLEDGDAFDDFNTKSISQFVTGKCWINNHAHVLRPLEDPFFLHCALSHKDIRAWTQLAGQSRKKLTQENMLKITLDMPCLEEQRLIANFLSDFDEAIMTAKKELELWKYLKKGLLQQMFV